MKKIVLFALLLVVLGSCKKEEKLQPSWWDRTWHTEYVIMKKLDETHTSKIIPKIDAIRTTLQQYVMWDSDTIQVFGPGGYNATSQKAWKVWLSSYQKTLMPDTLTPSSKGEWANIVTKYLELRRDYDKDKAFKKLWLCIPKDLYEQDGSFWEWFLSETSEYLTVVLGGPNAWTDGTRQLWKEMEIYHLPTTPDPKDPWGCNCSAETRITVWYQDYAEGPKKKANQVSDYERVMRVFKRTQAENRFKNYENVKDENFNISIEDLETKLTTINGSQYYVLQLPAVPTRE